MTAKIYLSNGPAIDPNNVMLPFDPAYTPWDWDLDAGTLLLVDPSHSAAPLAGVPGSSIRLPNIAQLKGNAGALLGGIAANTDPVANAAASLTLTTSGLAANMGALNLTPKKGLQGIITQQNQAGSIFARLTADDPIKNYILAKPTNTYLIVLEELLQRPAKITDAAKGAVAAPSFVIANSSGLTANILAYMNAAAMYPGNGKLLASQLSPGANIVGESFSAIVVSGWTGTLPALAAFLFDFGWGAIGGNGYNSNTWYNTFRSSVFRRAIVKDLTVAGKATAGLAAADIASIYKNWQRKTSPGGLWYGDAPIDPATLP